MNRPIIQPLPLGYSRRWMRWMFFIRFQKESGIIFSPKPFVFILYTSGNFQKVGL